MKGEVKFGAMASLDRASTRTICAKAAAQVSIPVLEVQKRQLGKD